MKMVRSLLLGSAAGLVAVAGAQAADLPLKAKPVEYVKVCSIYGAGFYYIPGTDTCIKVGGYVRMDVGINAGGSHSPYVNGANARDTRETNWYQTRVRGIVTWDARTQTEYGTLRAYINAGWELNSGDPSYRGNDYQFFYRAFIQFAGLTVGKTQSFFGFYANALNYSTLQGGGQSDAGLNLIAYTAQFGGGFSATLSLEDNQHHRGGLWDVDEGARPNIVFSAIPGGAPPAYGDYGGNRYPDVVANLRVDQPWGSAQLAAAIHDVQGLYIGPDSTGPSAGAETGWALAAGIKLNLPWAQGDQFYVQGTWARGATNYLGLNPFVHTAGQYAMYSGARGAIDQSFGSGFTLDGLYGTGSDGLTHFSLVEGWSILAAIQHYWTPSLRTSVFGHYTSLDYGATATDLFCLGGAGVLPGTSGVAGEVCNPDFDLFQVGTRTVWSPVRNLDIGVELLYTRLNQSHVGSYNLTAAGSRPAGAYIADDQDTWSGTVRFQRNFWP
jgi:hypothetical protein